MAHSFRLIVNDPHKKTRIIECKEKGLLMAIVPPRHYMRLQTEHTLEINVDFLDESLPLEDAWDNKKTLDFWVLNTNSERSGEWNKDLFCDVINWYCAEYIKREGHISILWNLEAEQFFDDDVILEGDADAAA